MSSPTIKVLTFWLQLAPEKGRGVGKKKKEKRTREDDIPPSPTLEAKRERGNLEELLERWLCVAHSKPGMPTYCWIEPAAGSDKGGHRELTYTDMTLWAKYIVSKKT